MLILWSLRMSEVNVFERVLRLAREEREARETRPMSAAMVKAAEAYIVKNRAKYLFTEDGQHAELLPET